MGFGKDAPFDNGYDGQQRAPPPTSAEELQDMLDTLHSRKPARASSLAEVMGNGGNPHRPLTTTATRDSQDTGSLRHGHDDHHLLLHHLHHLHTTNNTR